MSVENIEVVNAVDKLAMQITDLETKLEKKVDARAHMIVIPLWILACIEASRFFLGVGGG